MTLPDAKTLTKLAAACRKAGITHFRSSDFEFTLSEHKPEPKTRKGSEPKRLANNDAAVLTPEDEVLTPEQALFWSTPSGGEETL
jgi:hypothetical protein